MARVTVEDCIKQIPNRFELVIVASERARKLDRTDAESMLTTVNDKNTVIALREIADGVSADDAQEESVESGDVLGSESGEEELVDGQPEAAEDDSVDDASAHQ